MKGQRPFSANVVGYKHEPRMSKCLPLVERKRKRVFRLNILVLKRDLSNVRNSTEEEKSISRNVISFTILSVCIDAHITYLREEVEAMFYKTTGTIILE